ncbi:MAG: cation transporter [Clostridiales bacterium]|nr:cation transporter [Clostridiales bacterium]
MTQDKNKISVEERARLGTLSGIAGIIVNLLLFGIKLIAGLLSGSVAIIADATNNLSDAGTSIITAISFKLAEKRADREHPFGHARIEYIAGLIVSFIIVLLGVELFKSSIKTIVKHKESTYTALIFIILITSVIIKLLLALFYKNIGKKINSVSLEAAATDSLSDVLSTGVVIVGAIISKLTGYQIDGWLGAAVALFILISGIKLIKETTDPLLGAEPDPEYVKEIADEIMSYEGVLGMHDLVIHSYGSGRTYASVHIEVSENKPILESHELIDNIENDFVKKGVQLVAHLDPVNYDDPKVNYLRMKVTEIVRNINLELDIHDFRVVLGKEQSNLIFDVDVPVEYEKTDAELVKLVTEEIHKISKEYNPVITIDRGYERISKIKNEA